MPTSAHAAAGGADRSHPIAFRRRERTRAPGSLDDRACECRPVRRTCLSERRKHLLFWLKLLMHPDGAIAVDVSSLLFWSQAMLEDECMHDADVDIEALSIRFTRCRMPTTPHASRVRSHARAGSAGRFRRRHPRAIANVRWPIAGTPSERLPSLAWKGPSNLDTDELRLRFCRRACPVRPRTPISQRGGTGPPEASRPRFARWPTRRHLRPDGRARSAAGGRGQYYVPFSFDLGQ